MDLGHNSAVCVFNKTTFTNATVMSETEIICDTPSILNEQGYSDVAEGQVVSYIVDISIDGGNQVSQSNAKFSYYREPTITGVSPPSGPIKGGTTLTVYGSGFAQLAPSMDKIDRRVVTLGHLQVEPISFNKDSMTIKTPAVDIQGTTDVSVALNGQQFTGQPEVHDPEKSVTFDYYKDPYPSIFYPSKGPTNGGTEITIQGYGFMLKRAHLKDRLWARFVDSSGKSELAPAAEVTTDNINHDSLSWTTPPVKAAQDALL